MISWRVLSETFSGPESANPISGDRLFQRVSTIFEKWYIYLSLSSSSTIHFPKWWGTTSNFFWEALIKISSCISKLSYFPSSANNVFLNNAFNVTVCIFKFWFLEQQGRNLSIFDGAYMSPLYWQINSTQKSCAPPTLPPPQTYLHYSIMSRNMFGKCCH